NVTRGQASGTTKEEPEAIGLDPRIRMFVEKSQSFFERAIESLPTVDWEAVTSSEENVSASMAKDYVLADITRVNHKLIFMNECVELTSAAVHLPLLERTFSTMW